jgi:hypothetical protein
MPRFFVRRLQGVDLQKVQHIPLIRYMWLAIAGFMIFMSQLQCQPYHMLAVKYFSTKFVIYSVDSSVLADLPITYTFSHILIVLKLLAVLCIKMIFCLKIIYAIFIFHFFHVLQDSKNACTLTNFFALQDQASMRGSRFPYSRWFNLSLE